MTKKVKASTPWDPWVIYSTDMTHDEFMRIEDDRVAGKLSGFPPCCIEFYVRIWLNLRTWQALRDSYLGDKHWGYVPCPHCLHTNNRVPVVKHPERLRKSS